MGSAGAKAELMVQAMEHMGYSALAIGEMDLYLGLERLRSLEKMTTAKFLSANLTDSKGRLLFERSAVFRTGGVRVGVIGLTAQPADKRVLARRMAGAKVRDPFEAAVKAVDEIRGKCDLLILLSNLTFAKNLELSERSPAST